MLLKTNGTNQKGKMFKITSTPRQNLHQLKVNHADVPYYFVMVVTTWSWSYPCNYSYLDSLQETQASPSAPEFAECQKSGTWRRKLRQVPSTRRRNALGEA